MRFQETDPRFPLVLMLLVVGLLFPQLLLLLPLQIMFVSVCLQRKPPPPAGLKAQAVRPHSPSRSPPL